MDKHAQAQELARRLECIDTGSVPQNEALAEAAAMLRQWPEAGEPVAMEYNDEVSRQTWIGPYESIHGPLQGREKAIAAGPQAAPSVSTLPRAPELYENLWRDFVSLQHGDAAGICAKVEAWYAAGCPPSAPGFSEEELMRARWRAEDDPDSDAGYFAGIIVRESGK